MLKACAACGKPSPGRYCPSHAHLATGQRGSTRTWRNTRRTITQRDGLVCAICFQPVDPDDVHIDHVVAKHHGGTDDPSNLRVTHSRCNLSRGTA